MLRPRSPQPCSRCLSRRLRRPFDRSTYTSMSSGRSPAESAWPRIAPRGCRGRSWPRFALSSALGEACRRDLLARPLARPSGSRFARSFPSKCCAFLRRITAPRFALVRAIHRRSASPGFVARVYALFQRYAPRHACASARLSRTAALRVAKLAHRAFNPRLARPTLSKRTSCPPRSKTVFATQRAAGLV